MGADTVTVESEHHKAGGYKYFTYTIAGTTRNRQLAFTLPVTLLVVAGVCALVVLFDGLGAWRVPLVVGAVATGLVLGVRAATCKVEVRSSVVIVKNPLRTYWLPTSETSLAFVTEPEVALLQENDEISSAPKLVVRGKRRNVPVRALGYGKDASPYLEALADALDQ